MGQQDRSTPPPDWCTWWESEIHQLTPDIFYGWPGPESTGFPDDPNPWFWHWCSKYDRWRGAAASKHELVSREPLHMEPSLLWPCCGTHGFCRNGIWVPA